MLMKNGFIWGWEFNTSSLSALHSPKADMCELCLTLLKWALKQRRVCRKISKFQVIFNKEKPLNCQRLPTIAYMFGNKASLSWRRWRRGDGWVLDSSVWCLMAAADKQVCGSFVCDADQTDGWVHAGTDSGMDRDSDSQASCSFINITHSLYWQCIRYIIFIISQLVCQRFCWMYESLSISISISAIHIHRYLHI